MTTINTCDKQREKLIYVCDCSSIYKIKQKSVGKEISTLPVIVPPTEGIVTSKVVLVKFTVSKTVNVSSFGTVPEL